MSNIYVNDNGTLLSFTIKDEKGIVDLTSANVIATLKKGTLVITKEGSIVKPLEGHCEVVLNESDTCIAGRYSCQLTVNFSNGNKFSSSVNYISISPLIV